MTASIPSLGDQIHQLYLAYLGRPADPAGLEYWINQVNGANGSLAGALGGFSDSIESAELYGYMSTAQVITALYANLFNRQPDAPGLAYWMQELNSGSVTQAHIALAIVQAAQDTDAAAIAHKLVIAKAFTGLIDTVPEITGYSGVVSFDYARGFLKTVGADDTSVQAADSYLPIAVAIATGTYVSNGGAWAASGQVFTLTAGDDIILGTPYADTITSSVRGGFGGADRIDGGAGIDRLLVTDTDDLYLYGVTVRNIDSASLTSDGSILVDASDWSGLRELSVQGRLEIDLRASSSTVINATVRDAIAGFGSVEIGGGSDVSVDAVSAKSVSMRVGGQTGAPDPSGAIDITSTSTATANQIMDHIEVYGGRTIHVTQKASNAVGTTVEMGYVSVYGGAGTTSVVVEGAAPVMASSTFAGATAGYVEIEGTAGGRLTDIVLSNYAGAFITDSALLNLHLKGGAGDVQLFNSASSGVFSTTLNLGLDGMTHGVISDSGVYRTLHVSVLGSASTVQGLQMAGVTGLSLEGTHMLSLQQSAGLSNLQTLTVSGSAGLATDALSSTVTAVDASATSGNVSLTLNGLNATYLGGSGVDRLTISGALNQQVDGGAGNLDVLTLTADAATATATGLVTGFEQLTLVGAAGQEIDLSRFTGVHSVSTLGGTGLKLNGFASGDTLQLTGAGTAYTLQSAADVSVTGAHDTLNLALTSGSGAAIAYASSGITATSVANVVITQLDTQAIPDGAFNHSLFLLGNVSQSITVSGNAGLNLTAQSTALTEVDASGITLGGFAWASGVLQTGVLDVKGSASGTNLIDLSAATNSQVNYTGGTGNDTVTLGAITQAVDINVGTGTDRVVLSGSATTKTGFAQLTGMGTGDVISFGGALGGASAVSTQTTLGGPLAGQQSLDAYLDAATVGDGSAHTVLSWFQLGSSTYIVQDTSASSTFSVGQDTVIKLVGHFDLSASTVSNGVVTLNALAI